MSQGARKSRTERAPLLNTRQTSVVFESEEVHMSERRMAYAETSQHDFFLAAGTAGGCPRLCGLTNAPEFIDRRKISPMVFPLMTYFTFHKFFDICYWGYDRRHGE
ncbi:hypothetical protein U1Q18_051535 [Sarracenia purpurea var. burkii]